MRLDCGTTGRLVRALRFDSAGSGALDAPDLDWNALLATADREHLTLALAARRLPGIPDSVQQRLDGNLAANAVRFDRIRESYLEIAERLSDASIEHVVLKGFSHWHGYVASPRHRPQYDLDLLCQPADIARARGVVQSLGYEPLFEASGVPLDHAPPMIRKTGWKWRGDYFDPDLPVAVELHFRLWDRGTERIEIPGLGQFWERQTRRAVEDFEFPALHRSDTLAYAALHFLRHLLRGDFRLYHAYEIARFLHLTADCDDFWRTWRVSYGGAARSSQAVVFQLAALWFGCRMAEPVAEEAAQLSEPVQRWFSHLAEAPIEAKEVPNKNELWLHLSLLENGADRAAVLVRRLAPKTHATRHAAHIPDAEATVKLRLERLAFQARFSAKRLVHHARALAPTLAGGLRWGLAGLDFDPQLRRFLGAAALFNSGMSVFFLLFNLLLLKRGFHEETVGMVASAMSLGSIAGTLPGAFVLGRFGLRNTLTAVFAGVAAMCALRVVIPTPAAIVGSAFLGGLMFAFYAVAIPPTVARLTTERTRQLGFSVVFFCGIGAGVLAGLVGGRLPALLEHVPGLSGISLEATLLLACAIAATGAIAAAGLHFREEAIDRTGAAEPRIYPADSTFYRLLAALLIWNVAVGAFNPFFNVYFVKELGMAVSDAGTLFSASQAMQMSALVAAPWILRRLGTITGLATMQCATAFALGGLAMGPAGMLGGMIYAAYSASQYMSEPAIYTLLMERVSARERNGASALNFLIVFGGQAIAAAAAGFAVRRYGYRLVLALAGLAALCAGLLMRGLLERRSSSFSRIVPMPRA